MMRVIETFLPISLAVAIISAVIHYNTAAYFSFAVFTGLFFSILFLDAYYRVSSLGEYDEEWTYDEECNTNRQSYRKVG